MASGATRAVDTDRLVKASGRAHRVAQLLGPAGDAFDAVDLPLDGPTSPPTRVGADQPNTAPATAPTGHPVDRVHEDGDADGQRQRGG